MKYLNKLIGVFNFSEYIRFLYEIVKLDILKYPRVFKTIF